MSWWQAVILGWLCYMAGFATAALMTMARDDDEAITEARRSAGLNDD